MIMPRFPLATSASVTITAIAMPIMPKRLPAAGGLGVREALQREDEEGRGDQVPEGDLVGGHGGIPVMSDD